MSPDDGLTRAQRLAQTLSSADATSVADQEAQALADAP